MNHESSCITLAGEKFVCLPERALWWPSGRMLLVADVHLGKADSLRAKGMPVPNGHNADDLEVIAGLMRRLQAQRLVVLGDWVHDRASLTHSLDAELARFRARLDGASLAIVMGNHDRKARLSAERWGFAVHAERLRVGDIECVHAPPADLTAPDALERPMIAGHLHPSVRLSGSRDGVRLPCFWRRERLLVLPAFGRLTGTMSLRLEAGDEVILIAGNRLVHHRPGRDARTNA